MKKVTEHPHIDNDGARYDLFGNQGVLMRLLVAKHGRTLFFPLTLLLKPNVLVKKLKNAFLLFYFN